MADPWFELIKTAGSLSGLASGVFLIWDRFMRDRPHASFHVERFLGRGEPQLHLRVKNGPQTAIWIRSFTATPPSFGIAESDSVEGTVEAVAGTPFAIILAPEEARLFPVIALNNLRADGTDAKPVAREDKRVCRIKVSWRSMRRPNQPQLPVWIGIRPIDARAIRSAR
jgi:hypothetical protein